MTKKRSILAEARSWAIRALKNIPNRHDIYPDIARQFSARTSKEPQHHQRWRLYFGDTLGPSTSLSWEAFRSNSDPATQIHSDEISCGRKTTLLTAGNREDLNRRTMTDFLELIFR